MAGRNISEELDEKSRYWQEELKAYEESGLSQRGFCKVNGICLSTLRNWKRKLSGRCLYPLSRPEPTNFA